MLNIYVADMEMKQKQVELQKAARMAWIWNQPQNVEPAAEKDGELLPRQLVRKYV